MTEFSKINDGTQLHRWQQPGFLEAFIRGDSWAHPPASAFEYSSKEDARFPFTAPVVTSASVNEHLVSVICPDHNINLREAAQNLIGFSIADTTQLLIELGEVSPEFTQAVLEFRLSDAASLRSYLEWKQPTFPQHEAREAINCAFILDQFADVHSEAIWAGEEVRRRKTPGNGAPSRGSPVVTLAMKCATLAESIERYEYVPLDETPAWLLVPDGKTEEVRQSKLRFLQIFMFHRAVFVRDHALKSVNVPTTYSQEWVDRLSDLPQGDPRPAREIVESLRRLASQGQFGM